MGMDTYYDLKDMLCKELDEVTRKGELSAGSLDVVDKLTHSIKSLETIIAMNEASRDGSYDGMMYGGGSYEDGMNSGRGGRGGGRSYEGGGRSYEGGNSYARRGRDSMGRFTSRGGGRRYSRGEDDMKEQLEEMISEASSEREREVLREAISQLK